MKKFGKLRESIGLVFGNNIQFAAAMNMNPATLSRKLSGKVEFTRAEIEQACELLNIPKEEIPSYFFYTISCINATI